LCYLQNIYIYNTLGEKVVINLHFQSKAKILQWFSIGKAILNKVVMKKLREKSLSLPNLYLSKKKFTDNFKKILPA
jgi:hypothetical protein